MVQITSVSWRRPLDSRAARTRPICRSRVRAASTYEAMSRRISGASGNGDGGCTKRGSMGSSPSAGGSNPRPRRWVAVKPTSRKKGRS